MTNPTFGEKEANVEYVTRYGVYAVIPDEKKEKIILVQAPNGAWFLPGGEIEEGENHQTALERELMEELDSRPSLDAILDKLMNIFTPAIATPISTTRPTCMRSPLSKKSKNRWKISTSLPGSQSKKLLKH